MKSTIIKICELLLMIFFFIPVIPLSSMDQTFSVNGADLTFGKDVNGRKVVRRGCL